MSSFTWDTAKTSSSRKKFLRLEVGDQTFRIFEDVMEYKIHWYTAPGIGKKPYRCLKNNCPLCKVNTVSQRYAFWVLDRRSETLKVLEVCKTVFDQIRSAKNSDPSGHGFKDHDWRISRIDSGRVVYTVIPSLTATPFSDEELLCYQQEATPDALKDILKQQYSAKTSEELEQIISGKSASEFSKAIIQAEDLLDWGD